MYLATFVSLCGATLAILLAVRLLLAPTENRPAALTLAGFLICTALFVFDQVCYSENWFVHVPHFYAVANPFIFALGPCFYLYARTVTEPTRRWRPIAWAHFTPSILFALGDLPTYLLPAAEKVRLAQLDFGSENPHAGQWIAFVLVDSYSITYCAMAWWRLWRHRQRLVESREEGRTHPFTGIGLFATLLVALQAVSAVLDFTPWAQGGGTVVALAGMLAMFVVVWSLAQTNPLTLAPAVTAVRTADIEASATSLPVPDTASAKKSADLRPEEQARIARRVRHLFEEERVFLDPDLSLQNLAELAQSTRHKLSAVLKAEFGVTFYQMIARHRARAAAELLRGREGRTKTIAAISCAVGFNTLSAFNAAFRAEFGQTPSKFRTAQSGKPAENSLAKALLNSDV